MSVVSDVLEGDSRIIRCQSDAAVGCNTPMKCTLVVMNAVNVSHLNLAKIRL